MRYFLDLAERAFATYLEAFLGLLIVGAVLDISAAKAAAVAALPAALSVVKSGLGAWLGRSDTASLLPASKDPATVVPAAAPVS